jgi:uncharacterized MAPEG superfamily protein
VQVLIQSLFIGAMAKSASQDQQRPSSNDQPRAAMTNLAHPSSRAEYWNSNMRRGLIFFGCCV